MELKALSGLCSNNHEISKTIFATLTPESFHDKYSKEIHRRVLKHFRYHGAIPELSVVKEDLGLSEQARDLLSSAPRPPKSVESAEQVTSQLQVYSRTRHLYRMSKSLIEAMEEPQIDLEELVKFTSDNLRRVQVADKSSDVINYGKEANAESVVVEILYGEDNDSVIPTGFKTFDEVNGGMFRGSLVTIGGSSGSGKSLISNQLCINQSRIGYKVTNVPLEMSVAEVSSRILANVSGMNSIDIFLKRLASGERDAVYKKYRQYNRRCLKTNGRYTIFKPRSDISMEDLINALEEFNSDVIYVDYVSLLKDADGDEQWKKLGQIARFGKIHAENKSCVVVLLAQVDDDGRIRYSQAIKEHSSLAWIFTATKESRERGVLNINMLKSRNQVMRPFTLKIDYSCMRVTDPTPEEIEKYGTPTTSKVVTKKKASSSEYVPDLAE